MLRLSQDRQARAREFIMTQARPLDRALYGVYFGEEAAESGREAVFAALAAFQNPDGGFGHGLEIDVRLADSSPIATTVGLQVLREMGAGADHLMVRGAIRYLLTSVDAEHLVWLPVPPNVDEAPHGPWWAYRPDPMARLHNPRPEIAGYFVQYGELVPAEMRDSLVARVIADLEAVPDQDWKDSHDDLLCYVRLAESPGLAAEDRARVLQKLGPAVRLSTSNDPADWVGYVLMPLKLVRRPDGLFADVLAAGIQAQLDREIAAQGEDGAWNPGWTWFGHYDAAWPQAEQEWKGRLTLEMLLTLRAFGRLE